MHQVSNSSLRLLRLYLFDRHINFPSMSSAEANLETEAEVISEEHPTKRVQTTLDTPTPSHVAATPTAAGGFAVPAGTDSDKAKSTVPEDPVKRHLRRLQQSIVYHRPYCQGTLRLGRMNSGCSTSRMEAEMRGR